MALRDPLAPNEWYHCYNRGVDKRIIFEGKRDYDRFLLLLYVGNGSVPIHLSNLSDRSVSGILTDTTLERGNPLVEIGAYAFMPNHFHLALKEIRKGGITSFMQRVCTGYTMYFNKKYERTGALFSGPFKSRHVADDEYIKMLVSYIHLNPAEIFDKNWKGGKGDIAHIKKSLLEYRYSSLPDFLDHDRLERKILGNTVFELFDTIPTLDDMVDNAHAYYEEMPKSIKARP